MKKETKLNINGIIYETSIEYRNVRYIRYRIENDHLYIICPYFVTKDYLIELISKRKMKKSKNNSEKPFENDYCFIYGKKEMLENNFVNIDNHYILFNKDSFYKDIEKYFYHYVDERIHYYENLMGIPDHYNLTIRFVKTRYGSNSKRTHHITINSYLIHFSKEIIDAIIVHELAHNFHYDHSKSFYEIVYKYCPDYKALHKCLRLSFYQGVNK